MRLKLLVIRTAQLKLAADFYRALGFEFVYHKHEKGVYHYSTTIGDTVFEIYPLLRTQTQADMSTRLGFEVKDFEGVLQRLQGVIVAQPAETEFGLQAILKDPDGRKVEIYKPVNI